MRFLRELGRRPDRELAVRMGVSLTAVVAERRRRGITAFRKPQPPIVWTPEMESLLGVAPDPEVAAELGIPVASVRYRRMVRGIPARDRPRKALRFWTRRRVARLGTAVDGEVARELGISRGRVAIERRRRGIAPFQPRASKIVWTAAMVRQMGEISDRRIARRYGVGEDAVRRERNRRGIAPVKSDSWKVLPRPELKRIVALPTREAIARTGLNVKTIWRLRAELGVPQPPPGGTSSWSPRSRAWLGKLPDEEVARRLGLKVGTARLERRKLGINYRPLRRWTEHELELVRRLDVDEASRVTGRTKRAVLHMRAKLGLRGRTK